MGSLFGAPKAPKTQMPTPSVPAKPEVESAEDMQKMIAQRGGRARTVSAGLLQSSDDYNIGKKTLLG